MSWAATTQNMFVPWCCSQELCRVAGAASKRVRDAGDVAPMELGGDATGGVPAPATKAPKLAVDVGGDAPGARAPASAPAAAQEGDCLIYVRALGLSLARVPVQACR